MGKQKPKNSRQINKPKDYLEKLDSFFNSKSKLFFIISAFFTLLFSFLLFSFRVSEAGDDSTYIFRAYEFIKESKFPGFQGPLYPIFLSLFIWIFGLNITLLKSLSLISILSHLYFFYRAFKGRVSGFILFYILIIISFNGHLLSYSSQTFNEAFFLMLQAIFIFFFFNYIIDKKEFSIKNYIIAGLLVFLIGNIKTIGYSSILAVLVYLLMNKKWKGIGVTLVSFIGFYFILKLVKIYLFDMNASQFGSQLDTLLNVDPYDASKGQETFSGFLTRFMENSKLYLSKHFFNFLGLNSNVKEVSVFKTLLVYLLFIVSVFFSFKKNKYLFFTGLYLIFNCGATFIALQTRWDQARLIIIYFPLILLFILTGLYYLGKVKSFKFIKVVLPVLMIVIFFTNLQVTTKKVKANDEYLMQTLAGNKFYGLTPDWVNYIKMSQWAAKNVPEDNMIACRKPSISFIYAKRKFYGIYRFNTEDADQLLKRLKENNVEYVVMANLRKYPHQKTEYTINTIQRYLYYIQLKYPEKIQLVKTIGNDEQAHLLKIIH